jgi:hypothetical protein
MKPTIIHPKYRSLPSSRSARKGFALVVTLSLMILLTVIAVGLLTLSSVSLRSSSQSTNLNLARSNARMALMIAIGELQKQAGVDTRITAPADILDQPSSGTVSPMVTGVWKSWEGSNHEQSGPAMGRPVSVGDYKQQKRDRFLSWLVSGDPAQSGTLPDTKKGIGKAILLGDKTVGAGVDREKLQIHLTPTAISNLGKRTGSYAWWVAGENQKARLPKPYDPKQDNSARWAMNAKSHAVGDPEPFGMVDLLTDSTPAQKGISLKQADFISKSGTLPTSQQFFHDLSPYSVGLLCNVATGGWKKDLSLLTERWSSVGTTSLPFFRLKPGEDLLYNIPSMGNKTPDKSVFYPWSGYRGAASDPPSDRHPAVTSWENLKNFALSYRTGATISGSGQATMDSFAKRGRNVADTFDYLHKVRVTPVLGRAQWIFSHAAGKPPAPKAGETPPPAGYLEPRLLLSGVFTLWNPYNVTLKYTEVPLRLRLWRPMPAALQYTVNGVQNSSYNRLMIDSDTSNYKPNNLPQLSKVTHLIYEINEPFTLKPGETRVFSPEAGVQSLANNSFSNDPFVVLKPGYRSTGGHYFVINNSAGKPAYAPPTSTLKANARFDTTTFEGVEGVGIVVHATPTPPGTPAGDRSTRDDRLTLRYRAMYSKDVAEKLYKPLEGLAESPSLNTLLTNPSPFLTAVLGARMASKTHMPSKGFVQSSPFVNFTAMGGLDEATPTINRHYPGTDHPVNSPFDFSFLPLTPLSDILPNAGDSSNRGYVMTGFQKGDGLSRCVVCELPTRPIQSLVELQSWDLRYDNPVPPFAYNLIGNSDATPLLPSDSAALASGPPDINLQHDDSYCANHLLFDDWFASSITPDPAMFGQGGSVQKTFTDFLLDATGDTAPLGNRAYRPLAEDLGFTAGQASNAKKLHDDHVAKPDSWKTIASRLEVEGMFNVNSTSETAWRVLLGHARNQRVPYMLESGSSWSAALSDKSDFPVSRFSVAADVEASKPGSSGAFADATQFTGYRVFNKQMIDALAKEVVKQVRLRGPFLSLSEFVNRQLSTGELALAGALQTALNEMAKSTATNPYKVIEEVLPRYSAAAPEGTASAEYAFPQAAVGHAGYGLPGWTRQADILRPLAPILTVRDDTFVIRTYGDARDAANKVTATAVCEAVVRRTRNFVDTGDAAEISTSPTSEVNRKFGRRFELVSFRWLSPSEI